MEVHDRLAGYRTAAARLAGLEAVPCWVREMTDDAAFMALVLANSQSGHRQVNEPNVELAA